MRCARVIRHWTRGVGLVLTVALLLPIRSAHAEGAGPLILPLAVAIAIGQSAAALHAGSSAAWTARARSGLRAALPPQLWIPDLYQVDLDRDPPRFAAPIDRDKMVGLKVLPRRWHGLMLSVSFDTDSPAPMGRSSQVGSVVLDVEF